MVTNPRALEQLAFRGDLLLGHPVFTKPTLLQHQQQQQRPLSSYRAMMHIDLLPEAQGRGWGRKLIDRFVESVVQAASATGAQADGGEEEQVDYGSGIWIGVSPENRKVLAFYERVGFRLVMNDDEEGVVLVKDIPAAAAVRGEERWAREGGFFVLFTFPFATFRVCSLIKL
ncbi:[ribosomal protein S18]-alanine N-acetyltransferase [Microdochium nivale]|nr:[ribosomal protein S18]-alanine N-acetyltransferase [Microdochium nivale]